MINHNANDYAQVAQKVLKVLTQYLQKSQNGAVQVLNQVPLPTIRAELNLDKLLEEGGLSPDNIDIFVSNFLSYSMHMHHPHYMGHQVAVPHPAAAIAEAINGLISNPMSIYEMGPGAATIERTVVDWMLKKVGWEHSGAGLFTHGGSLANIHALLSARAKTDPNAWDEGPARDLVVLAPASTHYSIARAVAIIGLGQKSLVPVPTDHEERLIPSELERLIRVLQGEGKRIMAVVANACATSTGLHDPLAAISTICSKYDCWFHVDSPHGATALLSQKYGHLLSGIEHADSMVWDAHKMMQTGSLSTALLFKNKENYQYTFIQKASYLLHEKDNPGYDVLPYQIECTKAGLATKLFFVLASIGESRMGQFVEDLYDRTQLFANIISETDGFCCDIPVESNILTFRYMPEKFDQLQLRQQLINEGNFYITSTEVSGTRYLRLVLMHLGTTTNTLQSMLDSIKSMVHND